MKEQIITFETAILAKEKGFNTTLDQTPTQSLLQKWIRETRLLDVLVLPQVQSCLDPFPLYFYAVQDYRDGVWKELVNSSDCNNKETFLHFETYEEALEKGLFESLKAISNS